VEKPFCLPNFNFKGKRRGRKKILKSFSSSPLKMSDLLFQFTFSDVLTIGQLLKYLSNTSGQGTLILYDEGIKFAQGGAGNLSSYFNVLEFPRTGFTDVNNYIINIPDGSTSIEVGFDFIDLHNRVKSIPKNMRSSLTFTMPRDSTAFSLTKKYLVKGSSTVSESHEVVPIGNYEVINHQPQEPDREWGNPNLTIKTAEFCAACKDFSSNKTITKILFRLYENHFHIVGSKTMEGNECEVKYQPYGTPTNEPGEPIITIPVNNMLVKSFDAFKGIGSDIYFFASTDRPLKMIVPVGGNKPFGWLTVYLSKVVNEET